MAHLKPAILLSLLALTACGGGGGGGHHDSGSAPETSTPSQPDTGTTPAPEQPQSPPESKATLGSVSGITYTTPDGIEYQMRRDGITFGGTWTEGLVKADGTRVSSTSWCCGPMSYTLFGSWTSQEKGEHGVFYSGEGTAAANVPTQGTATYVGSGMRDGVRTDASFNVDFAAKTINGNITGHDDFGSAVAMQGTIVDGGFRGDAQSGGDNGTFVGHFNGPAAEELGGIAEFADTSKSASFGATKQ